MPRLLSLESFGSEKAQESVGSLGDLPVEIIEKILEGILEDDPYLVNAPITAGNAVAIDPYVWLSESKSAIQSPKPITKNEFALERGQTGQASEESIAQEGPEAQESVTARTRSNKSVDKTKESLSKLTFDSSRMNGLSVLRNLRV